MNNDIMIMVHKFGKKKWINNLIEGNISFSCAHNFIEEYRKTQNCVLGDELEGVFGHLKKGDAYISLFTESLKEDLEIIDDGDLVYLRRKSATLVPVFCCYSTIAKDILELSNPTEAGNHSVTITFDERLTTGFSQNCDSYEDGKCTIMSISPEELMIPLRVSLLVANIPFRQTRVKYCNLKDIFLIEPSPKYYELFLKNDGYSYQMEERIILHTQKVMVPCYRYCVRTRKLNVYGCNELSSEITSVIKYDFIVKIADAGEVIEDDKEMIHWLIEPRKN